MLEQKKKLNEMSEDEKYQYHLKKANEIIKKKKEREKLELEKKQKEVISKIFQGKFEKISEKIDLNSANFELYINGRKFNEYLN